MFRWKSEKNNKIKAVFKFQFQATQVPNQGWEQLMVSLFPADVGKPTARSEKAAVLDGSCSWPIPVYETVRLIQDSKTGAINEKAYQFFISANGSVKFGVLGEIAINLADYAEAFKPSFVSLPLKPASSETVLHVTVQRVLDEAEGRGTEEEGETDMKSQRNTLRSQLSNSELEEGKVVANLTNDIKLKEEVSCVNNLEKMHLSSSQTMNALVESNAILRKSNSMDAISASNSDSSSGYTPKENGTINSISQPEYGGMLSPLSCADTPRELIMATGNDWSIISAPNGSIDGLSSSSIEALLREGIQESDNFADKLNNDFIAVTRQLEVSKLELQTLRKQVVKESRRGHELASELQSMKEERNALEKECAELKASKKRAADEEHASTKLRFGGKDPWSMLEETNQELNHEKSMNANLHLQLKKTHESNSELILAVRDLEDLLQQKNKESCSCGLSSNSIKPDIMVDLEEIKLKIKSPQLQHSESEQELLETSAHEGDERYALVPLVRQPSDAKDINSPDQKIAHLATELELYKEREEIEMQMEQLALDYEILKQENHEISTKLEQIQLREQLRMQFESSTHFSSISDLETLVESLEKEVERQAEAFQVDLEIISRAKVEQEKRAIEAEEALRKARLFNYKTAEQLQEEFKRLTAQMSSSFYMNEKLVMETLKESSELQMQKFQLQEMLEKTNKELELVSHQHHIKSQQLLSLIDFKTKEVDNLHLELKQKRKELENQKVAEEARQKASSKQIAQLTAEVENLSRKSDQFAEQIKLKDNLLEEMDQLKSSITKSDLFMQEFHVERSMLGEELYAAKDEVIKLRQELNDLRQHKVKNDAVIRNLNRDASMHSVQYDGLKRSMSEDELDKENLRKQVFLRGDLQKEAGSISVIEKKIKEHNAKFTTPEEPIKSSKRSKIYKSKQAQNGIQDVSCLNEKTLLSKESRSNEDIIMNEKTKTKNLDSIGVALVISNTGDNPEIQEERSILCTCEQQKIERVLLEMAELKEQNRMMENELKDMQKRYSEMSLKFAEVEGERQLLVIKIRSLRNATKI